MGVLPPNCDLLEAWSRGLAGAEPRLAKRAWVVLQALDRHDPYALGEVASGTGRVHRWVEQYRAMGPIGLLDAPRVGRPRTVGAEVAPLVETASSEAGRREVARRAERLTRPQREAMWRQARQAGISLVRNMRLSRIPIPPIRGLPGLWGVLSLPGLLVVVRENQPRSKPELGQGTWLAHVFRGGGKALALHSAPMGQTPLITALHLSQAASQDGQGTTSWARLRDEMVPYFVRWHSEAVQRRKKWLDLEILIAQSDAQHAMACLNALRTSLSSLGALGKVLDGSQSRALPSFGAARLNARTYSQRSSAVASLDLGRRADEPISDEVALRRGLSEEIAFCWTLD